MGYETFASALGQRKIERVLVALADAMSIHEFVDALHITETPARRVIAHLMAERPRRIHIAYWERSRTYPIPFYQIGGKRNAARPRIALTGKEAWARMKADPVLHEKRMASDRRWYRAKSGLPLDMPKSKRRLPHQAASPFAALGL